MKEHKGPERENMGKEIKEVKQVDRGEGNKTFGIKSREGEKAIDGERRRAVMGGKERRQGSGGNESKRSLRNKNKKMEWVRGRTYIWSRARRKREKRGERTWNSRYRKPSVKRRVRKMVVFAENLLKRGIKE